VAAFLDEQIAFDDIPRIIEDVITATPTAVLASIKEVLICDSEARGLASDMVRQRSRSASPIRAIS